MSKHFGMPVGARRAAPLHMRVIQAISRQCIIATTSAATPSAGANMGTRMEQAAPGMRTP